MSIINFAGIYSRLASLSTKADTGAAIGAAPLLSLATPSPRVGLSSAFMFDTIDTMTLAGGTEAWDSTLKRRYYEHLTATATSARMTSTNPLFYAVESAPFYNLTASVNGVALPAYMTGGAFWVEFYGKWPSTAAAVDNDRGWGVSNIAVSSATPFSSAQRFASFYRKTTNGWTVVSADATTRSETSEAFDTSDNAFHKFTLKVSIKAGEIYLYVDDVLKVTKTTNLPAWHQNDSVIAASSGIGARSPSGDANGIWQLYGISAGWGD